MNATRFKPRTSFRGLGRPHQLRRQEVDRLVQTGSVRCCRDADCFWAEEVDGVVVGGLIAPGSDWDLDHTDDRRGYRGAAHAKCNRSAGARKGNARNRRSRRW